MIGMCDKLEKKEEWKEWKEKMKGWRRAAIIYGALCLRLPLRVVDRPRFDEKRYEIFISATF